MGGYQVGTLTYCLHEAYIWTVGLDERYVRLFIGETANLKFP